MKPVIAMVALGILASVPALAHEDGAETYEKVDCSAPTPEDLETCVAERRDAWQERGIVGMLLYPEEPTDEGGRWHVKSITPGGAAEEAGILAGDVVVAWGGEPVPTSESAVAQVLESVRVGDPVVVIVKRDGTDRTFELRARLATGEQREYWLLTYVYQNFPDEIYRQYETRVGQGIEHAGQ